MTTPHIRFLFVAPQFWIGLPSDPTSRRRPCPPSLRLCEHLARGLSPLQFCAMPGTHAMRLSGTAAGGGRLQPLGLGAASHPVLSERTFCAALVSGATA